MNRCYGKSANTPFFIIFGIADAMDTRVEHCTMHLNTMIENQFFSKLNVIVKIQIDLRVPYAYKLLTDRMAMS
jgi:hypothetical protein